MALRIYRANFIIKKRNVYNIQRQVVIKYVSLISAY